MHNVTNSVIKTLITEKISKKYENNCDIKPINSIVIDFTSIKQLNIKLKSSDTDTFIRAITFGFVFDI